jgi:hypothetical protein
LALGESTELKASVCCWEYAERGSKVNASKKHSTRVILTPVRSAVL